MLGSEQRGHPSRSSAVQSAHSRSASADDQPLRFLLIRTKAGELPWLAQTMAYFMAPVEIVQVIGMGNALWRLGHERFDSVLLDVDVNDRRIIRRCREQIADVAAVPVLDLHDRPQETLEQAVAGRKDKRGKEDRRKAVSPRQERAAEPRQTMRLPWQRRPKRQPAPPAIASAG